jgi:diaminopimelate decarboxylase
VQTYFEVLETRSLSRGIHILDYTGIAETNDLMRDNVWNHGLFTGRNMFAIKAAPFPRLLEFLHCLGHGFDCSSPAELLLAHNAGARGDEIMYTANGTPPDHLALAAALGVDINLDGIEYLDYLPDPPPKFISFRVNPGNRLRTGANKIIGKPTNQKYGVPVRSIAKVVRLALKKGVKEIGLHCMFASNCLDYKVHLTTLNFLLSEAEKLNAKFGIRVKKINAGGGLGLNYRPEQPSFDFEAYGFGVNRQLLDFEYRNGYIPEFLLECGRIVTGPHGILVYPVDAVVKKFRKFVVVAGSDATDLLRAGIYPAYHHIHVADQQGRLKDDAITEKVSVVGKLCENIHAASGRWLPPVQVGDYIIFTDTGAHGPAMTMPYNNWTRSGIVALNLEGYVELLAKPQTIADIFATNFTTCSNLLHKQFPV